MKNFREIMLNQNKMKCQKHRISSLIKHCRLIMRMHRASICRYDHTLKNSTKETHEARITSYGGAHPRL